MRDQHVYLNGISLTDAHPSILLQHISEGAAELDVSTADRTGAPGAFVHGLRLKRRQITVEFAVRERLDFAKRAEAVSAAAAWAMGGGWLTLSSRPGQRIFVQPSQLPDVGRLREWTRDIALVLEAQWWPLWTDTIPVRKRAADVSDAAITLGVSGTWPTNLEAEIVPKNGTLTTLTLTVDGAQPMTLAGLSVANDVPLTIRWDARHLLRIESGGTGLLSKRTGSDLPLAPGVRSIGFSADVACDVDLMARGCWL